MWINKQQLELDMEQLTGSPLGKKYNKAVYCHPAYLTYMQSCCCLVTKSYITLCDPMDCSLPGSSAHGDSAGQNTGVGTRSLLQGIFLTQELNQSLLHCRWVLYQLNYQGSPIISGTEPKQREWPYYVFTWDIIARSHPSILVIKSVNGDWISPVLEELSGLMVPVYRQLSLCKMINRCLNCHLLISGSFSKILLEFLTNSLIGLGRI